MPSDPNTDVEEYDENDVGEAGTALDRPPTAIQEPMYAQPLDKDGNAPEPPENNPLNTFVEQPRLVSQVTADAEQAHAAGADAGTRRNEGTLD